MDVFNVGIIGAGWIADKMSLTLASMKDIKVKAIASRDQAKADAFAKQYGIERAYGSYAQLVEDPDIDLVYIATPHSHHFEHASLAINAGKPVLCEKAFTANADEAERLIALADEKKVFLSEAVWTRYMPLSYKVKELIDKGEIGTPRLISSSLCYSMVGKERIMRPDLCGGALLDLGVYCLNFARMYFGGDIASVVSSAELFETGTDKYNSMRLTYADGKIADLRSSAIARCNREGIVCGDDGYIVVENINCPEAVKLYRDYQLVEEFKVPSNQITGYEYEVFACRDALREGRLETPQMPHHETVEIMKMMDLMRVEWGVRFPADK